MNERRIHQLFELSILAKGAHALVECLSGLVFAITSTGTLAAWADRLTRGELLEDPHDFVATHLRSFAHHFSVGSRHFYAFYLLSHGLVKVALVAGLLMNRLWAYPASLVVLGLFIVYQLYRFSHTHSWGLVALSAFDVVVVALIWHEWRFYLSRSRSRVRPRQ